MISRSHDLGDVVIVVTVRTTDVVSHSKLTDKRAEIEATIDRVLVVLADAAR